MKKYLVFLRLISRVELMASALLLFFIVFSILLQVVMRYGWNSPLSWVEEASTAAFIWITFLSAGLIYKEGRHMRIWKPESRAGHMLRPIIRLISNILIMLTSIYIIYLAIPIIKIENISTTVSLPIDLPKGIMFSIPVVTGFSSVAITALYFSICNSIRFINPKFEIESPSAFSRK